MRRLDHLIVSAASLESAMAELGDRLGVTPILGGRHESRGTHNALLSLGEGSYLEILAPDPEQAMPADLRFLGVGDGALTRLATWVAKASDLEAVALRARALGIELGEPRTGGRRRPDGTVLGWRLLGADQPRLDGLIPFFIDWGDSPHPSSSMPRGCTLKSLRAEHPEPERLRQALAGLDLDLQVAAAVEPRLIATLECPRGAIELR